MTKKTIKKPVYNKKTKIENILVKMDLLNKNLDVATKVLSEEIIFMRNEMSRLNETIYEDRRVLADFVSKFFKDTKTVLNPNLAIDGGRKAKGK